MADVRCIESSPECVLSSYIVAIAMYSNKTCWATLSASAYKTQLQNSGCLSWILHCAVVVLHKILVTH